MTYLPWFLGLSALLAVGYSASVMLAHAATRRRGRGLPEDVRRVHVVGPALGNSLWTGERVAEAVDVRRVA